MKGKGLALAFLAGFSFLVAARSGAQVREAVGATPQRDYIIPLPGAPAQAPADVADGDTVTYTAFDKTVYSLRQFNGKYTALLLQQADLDKFTLEKVRLTIDRNDVLYTQLVEFLGSEPRGEGLLRVAYVKTCGAGCGTVGRRGLELDPKNFTEWLDFSYAYTVHEMCHNFDLYSGFLFGGPDAPHSWTDFASRYIVVYNRNGSVKPDNAIFGPEEQLQSWIDQYFMPYVRYPGATWEACIRDNLCTAGSPSGIAQHTQGGVPLRLAQVYGAAAMKRWLPYVSAQTAARRLVAGSLTAAQKSDLLIESLSVATGANLACFFDWLKWPVGTDLRAQLGAQFAANVLCNDQDADGYSPFQGDLHDTNSGVNPGAVEVLNGLDEDCNGLVDDILFVEGSDFPDLSSPFSLPVPSRVRGAISSATDLDAFSIQLAATSLVKFTLKSTSDFKGWLFVNKQGSTEWLTYFYVSAGGSADLTVSLGPGKWIFDVAHNNASNPGAYNLALQTTRQWPIPFTALTPSSDQPGRYILRAPDAPAAIAGMTNPVARFWLSGIGWVGSAPVVKGGPTTMAWAAPDSAAGQTLHHRVQFYDGELPAIAVSDVVSFTVNATAMRVSAIVNGASFRQGPVAPGQIVSVFGSGMGPAVGVGARLNHAGLVDNSLSGTRVLFDGVAAPLFFARADQVNAVVPYAAYGKTSVTVLAEYNGTQTRAITMPVAPAAPGLFTIGSGSGQAALLNEDGSVNSAANPARKGTVVVLYATGEGQTSPTGVDGKLALPPYPVPVLPVTVTIGDVDAEIVYKGAAPGFTGLFQVNARVPQNAASSNTAPVVLTVGGISSQPGVTLAVR